MAVAAATAMLFPGPSGGDGGFESHDVKGFAIGCLQPFAGLLKFLGGEPLAVYLRAIDQPRLGPGVESEANLDRHHFADKSALLGYDQFSEGQLASSHSARFAAGTRRLHA